MKVAWARGSQLLGQPLACPPALARVLLYPSMNRIFTALVVLACFGSCRAAEPLAAPMCEERDGVEGCLAAEQNVDSEELSLLQGQSVPGHSVGARPLTSTAPSALREDMSTEALLAADEEDENEQQSPAEQPADVTGVNRKA
uniref:Uncharacterized protein n=1 Tax=Alexandrium monilatum TaxID=311494 RepID=A0A7S4UPP5_9DINO